MFQSKEITHGPIVGGFFGVFLFFFNISFCFSAWFRIPNLRKSWRPPYRIGFAEPKACWISWIRAVSWRAEQGSLQKFLMLIWLGHLRHSALNDSDCFLFTTVRCWAGHIMHFFQQVITRQKYFLLSLCCYYWEGKKKQQKSPTKKQTNKPKTRTCTHNCKTVI